MAILFVLTAALSSIIVMSAGLAASSLFTLQQG